MVEPDESLTKVVCELVMLTCRGIRKTRVSQMRAVEWVSYGKECK